jgi:DedD protein
VDQTLKQRLVGAAVLAALVVIFVPMLVGDPDEHVIEKPVIAEPAKIEPFASELLSQEVVIPERSKPAEVDLTEPKATTTKAKPVVERPKVGIEAWVVQVGKFSNRDNAQKLVASLRKADMQTPDPEEETISGKTSYRVIVGPFLKKTRAEGLVEEIRKISGTKAFVTSFQ